MTVETLPRPTTNPLAVPGPKPSEIVRSWPRKNWTQRTTREVLPDGTIRFCSLGILAETGGHDWHNPLESAGDTVRRVYGLTRNEMFAVMGQNDWKGKDAAADYLASIGK